MSLLGFSSPALQNLDQLSQIFILRNEVLVSHLAVFGQILNLNGFLQKFVCQVESCLLRLFQQGFVEFQVTLEVIEDD